MSIITSARWSPIPTLALSLKGKEKLQGGDGITSARSNPIPTLALPLKEREQSKGLYDCEATPSASSLSTNTVTAPKSPSPSRGGPGWGWGSARFKARNPLHTVSVTCPAKGTSTGDEQEVMNKRKNQLGCTPIHCPCIK
jgi:hypothetical protein